ncbi:MAG: threonylcarbamoyl-AMP synthase [Planctomycetes bacterium]|nr:threonylcarbamoyl-AMP synthase [Planctomycetota bacterium]
MKARVLAAGLDAAGLAHIEEAARAVAAGGLVAFPTETVYGIACNSADPRAIERLKAVKGRPEGKPFSLHVGRREDVARHVPAIPATAQKLMSRYWPGPLTIVFPTPDGQGLGVRMPSNAVAQELLKRAGVPVVAPSANRSGGPPATTADEVVAVLGDELDLVLDGGRTTYREASTVVRVGEDGSWKVLREGSVTLDMLRRTLGKTIVFVCTANTCRSPMAEMLCKQMLAERLGCTIGELPERGYNILSAGTAGFDDGPASYQGVEAMRKYGLDLSEHVSRPVTAGLVEDADAIYVMARHHCDSIRRILPDAADRIHLMDPAGKDVEDPVGGTVEDFLECARTLERSLRAIMPNL